MWVRRVSLSGENRKPNLEFRSFRAKMKEKHSRQWEKGAAEKGRLDGVGAGRGTGLMDVEPHVGPNPFCSLHRHWDSIMTAGAALSSPTPLQ